MKGHPVLSIVAVLVTMFATLANLEKKSQKKVRFIVDNLKNYDIL